MLWLPLQASLKVPCPGPCPAELLPLLQLWLQLVPHPLVAPLLRHDTVLPRVQQQVQELNHLETSVQAFKTMWGATAAVDQQEQQLLSLQQFGQGEQGQLGQVLQAWQVMHQMLLPAAAALASVAQQSLASKLQRQQGPPACWHTPKWASVADTLARAQRQASAVLVAGCPVEGEELSEAQLLSRQQEQLELAQGLAYHLDLVNLLVPPALTSNDFQKFSPVLRLGFRLCYEGDVDEAARRSSLWHGVMTYVASQGWKLALHTAQSIASAAKVQEGMRSGRLEPPAGFTDAEGRAWWNTWVESQLPRHVASEAAGLWKDLFLQVCRLLLHAQVSCYHGA